MHNDDGDLVNQNPYAELSRIRKWGAILVGVACFALFLITSARMPLPGDSVNNLLLLLRLSPVESFRNPLWYWMGRLVLSVTSGSPLLWIHGLNGMMGALCAGLLFWITSGIPHNRTSEEKVRSVRPFWPQLVSGLTAAALLALCAPFWFSSVRAFPQTLHVLLILLLVLLLMVYRASGRFRWIVFFSVLYGISLVESALLLLFAPLFFAACLVLLWHHDDFKFRKLVLLLVAFLTGLSAILLHAWSFKGTPTYVWREFQSYGHLLGVMLKDHYLLAMRGVPRVGWLMIGLFSVLPWLLIVPFPRTGEAKKKGFWGSYVLMLILTVFGIVVLSNHAITPWAQFGLMPLVVLPYLFLASWMGYLAGYWYIMAARPRRPGARARPGRRHLIRRLYLAVLTVGVGLLAVRNYPDVSDRQAIPAMGLARDVVASLEGQEWLVTNGAIDGLIQYAAFEAGVPLDLLNLGQAQAPLHRKYVASRLTDPRLRSLAMVGMGPLLDEWIGARESVTEDLAVLTHADLWQSKGYIAVPSGTVFMGAPEDQIPAGATLRERSDQLFSRMVGGLDAAKNALHPLPALNEWVFSHYSKVANNLGVLLEDQGDTKGGLDLYRTALNVNPENVSALLNAFSLTEGEKTEEARDIAARVAVLERNLDGRLHVWGLAYHHGYVRNPLAFLQMGWAWAMTGKAGAAIRDFERAAELAGSRSHLQMALAALYFREGRVEESEQAYFAMLVDDPDNTTAILGLARLAMRQGQYDQARGYLARLLELGVPADIIEFELASLEILMGNIPQATAILERLAEKNPEHLRASAMLTLLAVEQGDDDSLARYVARLEQAKETPPGVKLILAIVYLRAGANERARIHLEELVGVQPDHAQALEMLVKLDLGSGRMEDAEVRIRQIFEIDPGNAFANLALGSLQYVRGEYELAETSFQASIQRQPTSDALNSLAWVYMAMGRYTEAQKFSARAVRADARNAFAWDTLGEASLLLGNLELAERALLRASELLPDSPRIIFHLAQLYEAKGDLAQAHRLAENLHRHGRHLPADLYEDLLKFSERIR